MAKTFILSDWGYCNCVVENAPDGYIPWGYAVIETEDRIKVLNTIRGTVIRETEKAIQIEYTVGKTNSRCEIIKTFQWKTWIPKSQIVVINAESVTYFDGGESQNVERMCFNSKKGFEKCRFFSVQKYTLFLFP